jgi:hypothetical protein
MSKIRPHETSIICEWTVIDHRVTGNDACVRIVGLQRSHLERLSAVTAGWDTLYRDPDDGRLCPQSHLQGGGPPTLQVIDRDAARKKYAFETASE